MRSTLNNNLVLDLSGANTNVGSNIQLHYSNNTPAQKWVINYNEEGYYSIASAINNNKVFSINHHGYANGFNIEIASNTNI